MGDNRMVSFSLGGMAFEYDDNKNQINIKKHGISFKSAARIFFDYDRIEFYDEDHSYDEDRYNTIGDTSAGRISQKAEGALIGNIDQFIGKVNEILFVVYLLQYKDDEVCQESTSGGAFTGIASYVIERGGIVFGVEMTEEYKVRHTSVETIEELKRFRNSKYVQSRVGYAFRQVKNELKKGRMVCFSGTPCQIEGLRHFLGKDYQNLILVDVVCRAVPSPGVWEKYIQYEVEQKGKLSSIRFRDKSLGYQYSTMELRAENGKKYRGGIESQPWLRMFFSGMIIRPSCLFNGNVWLIC